MEPNWLIIAVVALLVLSFLCFIILRNRRDRKKFEDQLNRDFPKKKERHFEEEDPDDLKGR